MCPQVTSYRRSVDYNLGRPYREVMQVFKPIEHSSLVRAPDTETFVCLVYIICKHIVMLAVSNMHGITFRALELNINLHQKLAETPTGEL